MGSIYQSSSGGNNIALQSVRGMRLPAALQQWRRREAAATPGAATMAMALAGTAAEAGRRRTRRWKRGARAVCVGGLQQHDACVHRLSATYVIRQNSLHMRDCP